MAQVHNSRAGSGKARYTAQDTRGRTDNYTIYCSSQGTDSTQDDTHSAQHDTDNYRTLVVGQVDKQLFSK